MIRFPRLGSAGADSGVIGAALVCGVMAAFTVPPGHSHAIESSLERLSALNDQLLLEARFGTGEPADDAVVRLLPPGGEPLAIGRTDARGRLQFRLPSQVGDDWELQVDRGPGHRDYLELPGSAPAAPARPVSSLTLSPGWSPLLAGGLLGLGGLGLLRHRRQPEGRRHDRLPPGADSRR